MYDVPPAAESARPRSCLGWAWLTATSALALAEGIYLLALGAATLGITPRRADALAAGLVLGFGGGALAIGLALWRIASVAGVAGAGGYRRSGLQACFWIVLAVTGGLIALLAAPAG